MKFNLNEFRKALEVFPLKLTVGRYYDSKLQSGCALTALYLWKHPQLKVSSLSFETDYIVSKWAEEEIGKENKINFVDGFEGIIKIGCNNPYYLLGKKIGEEYL